MLHLRIFHGSGVTSFCFPFALAPAPTRTICEYTSIASGPETRITPIPPLPGGVDNAYIVFFSVGDGTTPVAKRLPHHSFRTAAFLEDSITVAGGQRNGGGASVGMDLGFTKFRSRFIFSTNSFCPGFLPHKPCRGYERVTPFGRVPSVSYRRGSTETSKRTNLHQGERIKGKPHAKLGRNKRETIRRTHNGSPVHGVSFLPLGIALGLPLSV